MKELYDLGIVHTQSVQPYFPRVRDRGDIAVLRDERSGVIFLSSTEHMNISHYDEMKGGSYWGGKTRDEALALYAEDDTRRAQQFYDLISGKDVLDVGCGTGGFMDHIRSSAKSVAGVEPQQYVRTELQKLGYEMYRLPGDVPRTSADVATLFHVLEHITEPLKTLKEVLGLLRPGGTVVIEVPHARDVLLQLEAFKAFTLWSEHLVLHTKDSLRVYLEKAGFSDIKVEGFQRYPLGNHVGWLVDNKPGGQKKYPEFTELSKRYEQMLINTDQTDTLIAIAKRPL